ncbi:MAG: ATP-dependent helicase, partial [Clostridiaceae bacterium]
MNLDKNQIDAVKSDEKRVLVIAAPGSGKTSVLLGRSLYLISRGVSPSNIMLLTFTKSAAYNMEKRIEIEDIKSLPYIGTFHSFLYSVLRRKGKINIISEEEKDKIIKDILKEFQDDINQVKIREIKNEISKYKRNNNYNSDMEYNTFIYIYEKYIYYLNKNSVIDFDDLEIEGIKEISGNKCLLKNLKDKYKYILVDEFQDVDDLEIKFLKLIGDAASLFFVGDEDQCIFSFRGSNPVYTYNFKNEFIGGKVYYLNNNYRSKSNIVTASEKLIKNNIKRSNKEINVVKHGGKISVIKVNNQIKEAEKVISIIKESKGSTGILYRNKKDAELLSFYLLNNNIFFNFYDDPLKDIKDDINSYILLSKNRFSKGIFKNIVNKPNRYISRLCLIKLDRIYLNKDVFNTLYSVPGLSIGEYRSLKIFERKLNRLKYIKNDKKVLYIIKKLGYGEYLEKKLGTKDFSNLINNLNRNEETSLTLSTIHKAKGTEYENIIILNCTEGNIPYFKNNDIEEERRIFYVALTRGISNVYFITREEESPFI